MKPGELSWVPEKIWSSEEMARVDGDWERYAARAVELRIATAGRTKETLTWTPAFARRVVTADEALPGKERGRQYSMQRFYRLAQFALELHLRNVSEKVAKAEKRELLYFICEAYRIQT